MMKRIFSLSVSASDSEQVAIVQSGPDLIYFYLRNSTAGMGGDFVQVVAEYPCGNIWTGGYVPFFSEGAVARFNDTAGTTWSNVDGYLPACRVYDIAFDQNDGMWVAVAGVDNGMKHGGISHCDGIAWSVYTSANSLLPYDDMRGIVVDHNNVV